MRRSLAIGGTLTRADIERLLDACSALLAQRAAVVRVLAELGPSWSSTRRALNELARVVNADKGVTPTETGGTRSTAGT
jgi:hypothetical protein